MTIFEFTRRTVRAGAVAAGVLGIWIASEARGLTPPVLALAFGLGGTPTPTPIATPTPTPTPSPTAEPPGPKTYNFPAAGPFVSIVLPADWTATVERSGRLMCTPNDSAAGYAATLSTAGNFSNPEAAKSYLKTLVKETLAGAKLTGASYHELITGKLGSGIACSIQIVDGKLGPVATSYVFMCFAPVQGRYVAFVAFGRSDKLKASGYDVAEAIADSVKPL